MLAFDGRTFSKIATVQSQGNSTVQQSYSYVDEHPQQGLNHYRIRQVDLDGKTNTTEVKSQSFDCQSGLIKVYPTVAKGILYVEMPAGYDQARISIFDVNGREITADITKFGLSGTVHFPSIAAGTYLLRVANNGSMETFKILYQP